MPSFFPEGNTALASDDPKRSLIKINDQMETGVTGRSGAGSPQGVVVAPPGTTYTDTSTGALWVKQTGTGNTGWTLISSVAGTLGVFGGNGSPVGVVIPTTAAALYVQFDSDPPYITWVWDGSWH